MTALLASARELAAGLLPALASHLWSSSLFLLAVLGVLLLTRRRLTAGGRYALALVGLTKLAVPDAAIGAVLRPFLGDAPLLPARLSLEAPLDLAARALRVDLQPPPATSWPVIAVAVWLLVAVGLLLRLAFTHRRLAALAVTTRRPAQPREVAALARARRRLGLRVDVDVARSTMPEAPALLRASRPLILLPVAGCDDLSDQELELLLCHECAHVLRRDNVFAAYAAVLGALFWFHPLVWIARRTMAVERERACDELVAATLEDRQCYLAALTKFCHAAIGLDSPGMSRLATAQIKERMEHVMSYAALASRAPAASRVTRLAVAALALFTVASALVGAGRAAAEDKARPPYGVRLTATRASGAIALSASIRDNATQQVIAAPSLTVDASRRGSAQSSAPGGLQVALAVRPEGSEQLAVEVTISKAGQPIQASTMTVVPGDGTRLFPTQEFTGEPIDLTLADADLREVLGRLGKASGLQMRIDDDVQGRVSTSWHNVPWDEALDTLVRENGLTYKLEGSTLRVSRR
jgi:beta-lactamase regulating signal transducer with metallopeptidase domain